MATTCLGLMHRLGLGVANSDALASEWIGKAKAQNYGYAEAVDDELEPLP